MRSPIRERAPRIGESYDIPEFEKPGGAGLAGRVRLSAAGGEYGGCRGSCGPAGADPLPRLVHISLALLRPHASHPLGQASDLARTHMDFVAASVVSVGIEFVPWGSGLIRFARRRRQRRPIVQVNGWGAFLKRTKLPAIT